MASAEHELIMRDPGGRAPGGGQGAKSPKDESLLHIVFIQTLPHTLAGPGIHGSHTNKKQ